MPIEVRRFGAGHRRPEGPPGSVALEGRVIASDAGGQVRELAFGRRARLAPHATAAWSYLLVVEGGGWVGVGSERARVQAGEAVVWPPDLPHAAWTDGTPMRAFVVEFREPAPVLPGTIAGSARIGAPDAVPVDRGDGALAGRRTLDPRPGQDAAEEGEPR